MSTQVNLCDISKVLTAVLIKIQAMWNVLHCVSIIRA